MEQIRTVPMTETEILQAQKNEALQLAKACMERGMKLEAQIAMMREVLLTVEGMFDEIRDYPITHDMVIEALAATEPKDQS